MKPETRRAALRATARVAMCSALLACPKPSTPESPQSPGGKDQACQVMVDAAWDEAGTRVAGVAQDDELKACCQALADAYDAGGEPMSGWADRDECCPLLDWNGSATCTPWGPPVPPAFV